jgi:hypothetical protein
VRRSETDWRLPCPVENYAILEIICNIPAILIDLSI